MQMPTFRNRGRWTRRVMSANAIRLRRVTPQTNVDFFKRIEEWQRVGAARFRENDHGLMREEPITERLTYGTPPVPEFALECACAGMHNFGERFGIGECFVWKRQPRHRKNVCDAITIYGNLARKSQTVVIRLMVQFRNLAQISTCERNREPVFRSRNTLIPRQIAPRFGKSHFRNDDVLAHVSRIVMKSRQGVKMGISAVVANGCADKQIGTSVSRKCLPTRYSQSASSFPCSGADVKDTGWADGI